MLLIQRQQLQIPLDMPISMSVLPFPSGMALRTVIHCKCTFLYQLLIANTIWMTVKLFLQARIYYPILFIKLNQIVMKMDLPMLLKRNWLKNSDPLYINILMICNSSLEILNKHFYYQMGHYYQP